MKWTKEEIDTAEGFAISSDHETSNERWEYVAEMMQDNGDNFPKRTPNSYRVKVLSNAKNKRESK